MNGFTGFFLFSYPPLPQNDQNGNEVMVLTSARTTTARESQKAEEEEEEEQEQQTGVAEVVPNRKQKLEAYAVVCKGTLVFCFWSPQLQTSDLYRPTMQRKY